MNEMLPILGCLNQVRNISLTKSERKHATLLVFSSLQNIDVNSDKRRAWAKVKIIFEGYDKPKERL